MTPRAFCQNGEREGLKGGFHGAACAIAAVMAVYNVGAWMYRREPRLLGLSVLYGGFAEFERRQTMRHWGKP